MYLLAVVHPLLNVWICQGERRAPAAELTRYLLVVPMGGRRCQKFGRRLNAGVS